MLTEGAGIRQSCGGFEVHVGSEPGKTLVGWYPSKTKAHAALRVQKQCPELDRFFLLLAFVQVAVTTASSIREISENAVVAEGV